MPEVTIRDLRNHGGEAVERASKGERLTITRSGKPVAELRGLPREPVSVDVLVAQRRHLPLVDPAELREAIDQILDPAP